MGGRVVVVWLLCLVACCLCLVVLVVFCFCGGWVVVCSTVFFIVAHRRCEAPRLSQ